MSIYARIYIYIYIIFFCISLFHIITSKGNILRKLTRKLKQKRALSSMGLDLNMEYILSIIAKKKIDERGNEIEKVINWKVF